jgi:gamma-glutamyl hydrolase
MWQAGRLDDRALPRPTGPPTTAMAQATRAAAIAALVTVCTASSSSSTSTNSRPIIGILSQPATGGKKYIAASYIKFVESAGARAVPIHYDSDPETLRTLVGSVNGVLFPGGSASLANSSQYYQAGKVIYDAAVKANDAGSHLPLWGTCLGFEEMARLLSGDSDEILVRGFDSEDYPVPLTPANDVAMSSSRIFAGMPPALMKAITTENITMNSKIPCG